MGKHIKLLIALLTVLGTSSVGYSQFSLGGGVSTFHGLNIDVNRTGFNFFVEVPRSTDMTMFIRGTYMLPDKTTGYTDIEAKVIGTTPSKATAELISKTSFFSVDGGTRHYFINDYDVGFSLFASPHLKGILASYSADYRVPSGLNPSDYQPSNSPNSNLSGLSPQYSLLFAFGGTVGVKYQLPTRGALLFDLGLELLTALHDPYAILGNEISPLSFSFNLGYRFDWY